jgi:hypothetical protein
LNYFFYRSKIINYDSFFSSIIFFTDLFQDVLTIKNEEKKNNAYSIKYSIADSDFFLLFGVLQKIIFIYIYMCFISSCVNSLEKAIQYESKKEGDEVLKKMGEIQNILEKEEENNDDSVSNLKKQILWINFESSNEIYNIVLGKLRNMLLFKNSSQVISFLKYLFALKPLIQFKSLTHKLCIVIQYSSMQRENKEIKNKITENTQALLEWLNFVGCKIPVIIYCESNFGFLQKIQVSTLYKLLTFTDNLNIIEKFINEEEQEDDNKNNNYKIVNTAKFTLYKVNYIIVKQSNNKSNNEDEQNSGDEHQIFLDNNINLKLNSLDKENTEDNKDSEKNNSSSIVSKGSASSSLSKSSHSN